MRQHSTCSGSCDGWHLRGLCPTGALQAWLPADLLPLGRVAWAQPRLAALFSPKLWLEQGLPGTVNLEPHPPISRRCCVALSTALHPCCASVSPSCPIAHKVRDQL